MKRLLLLALVLATSSCGVSSSLYYWGGGSNGATLYESLTYRHYDKHTPKDICKLICVYEDMVSNPTGTRKVPPPGICAEYAYLISQPEVVMTFMENAQSSQKRVFKTEDLAAFFPERAKELFEMEMRLYPESATFIIPLLDKLSNRQ